MKNDIFFIWWHLEQKLLTLGQIWLENVTGAWRELSNVFFLILSSYHILELIAIVCEKSLFSQNFTIGDLWWPQYWPDLKMIFEKVWKVRDLSNAVCRLSQSRVVF